MASHVDQLLAELHEEKERLEHEFKVDLPKAIGEARAHGDLSENAEYHAARERHAFVRAQISQLDGQISRLMNIDLRQISKDRVGLYSRVRLFEIETEEEIDYRLVTSEEADVDAGLISTSSPIGRGLLGKQVGDEAQVQVPSGVRTFEIVSLQTLHEQGENKG